MALPSEFLVTLPPFLLTALCVLFCPPNPIPKHFSSFFVAFLPKLTVKEAEELDAQFALDDAKVVHGHASISTAEEEAAHAYFMLQDCYLVCSQHYNLVYNLRHQAHPFNLEPYTPLFVFVSWTYISYHLIGDSKYITSPYDIVILLIVHLTCAGGTLLYEDRTALWERTAQWTNLAIVSILIGMILLIAQNIFRRLYNSLHMDQFQLGPVAHQLILETAPWGRRHMGSLINPEDTPYFLALHKCPASTFFRRLLCSNGMDLFIEFVSTEVSVLLDFLGSFFLNHMYFFTEMTVKIS
ncbi:hypothetical protein M422DRAFT_49809 [Sphaerobolus stellatus SS14]|uniref:Uncharacterized protein n=1 Tax=Sphaerobolus stellatus (strain SS14) TaxID=990650 RepID=A0A0C9VMM8_SPHS4|nr:hypothetical protein M422DRAFT_49809 [Sphaerobolus stellatus SS14]